MYSGLWLWFILYYRTRLRACLIPMLTVIDCYTCVFQNQAKGLSKWMKEMDTFLQTEHAAIGDIATLEAQIEESKVCSYLLH